jgi:hypothetical protein
MAKLSGFRKVPYTKACEGPLVWFDVSEGTAILECAACDYVIVTGNFFDRAHALTPILREGLA